MAQLLGDVAVGTIVKLKENGTPVDYIVVHQGKPSSLYDDSCNGTWLLRKEFYWSSLWNSSLSNNYAQSVVHSYLNGTFLKLFDEDIQSGIKKVKIPYVNGTGNSTVASGENGLLCQLFLLSGYELGLRTTDYSYLPIDGAKISYFLSGSSTTANNKRKASGNYVGSSYWWTRSPYTYNAYYSWCVTNDGYIEYRSCNEQSGVRPSLIFPTTALLKDDNSVFVIPIPTLTVPLLSYVTQPFTISWTSVESADSYTLQRNIDNSTWETVYTGLNLSYEDTISSGSSVQYRVCATALGQTGNYSNPKTVSLRQISPTPTLTMPGTVDLFTTYTISWNVVDNADGYIVQKQVNDGDWTQVYIGSGTSFQDSTFYLSTKYRIASTISAGDGYQSPWSQEYQLSINMSGTPIQMTINQDGSYNELYPTTLIGNILGMDKYGYSQQQILSNTTKSLMGLEDNAIPDQAFSVLQSAISSGAKIEVGSYTGNGKYGSGNPNTLTFGFVPIFFVVMKRSSSNSQMPNQSSYAQQVTGQFYAIRNAKLLGCTARNPGNSGSTAPFIQLEWMDSSVKWWVPNSNNAADQFNESGTTYDYIVIG